MSTGSLEYILIIMVINVLLLYAFDLSRQPFVFAKTAVYKYAYMSVHVYIYICKYVSMYVCKYVCRQVIKYV